MQRLESEHLRRIDDIVKRPLTVNEQEPILFRELRRHLRALIRNHDQIECERLAALESELVSLREYIRGDNKRRAAETREHRREVAAFIRDSAKS